MTRFVHFSHLMAEAPFYPENTLRNQKKNGNRIASIAQSSLGFNSWFRKHLRALKRPVDKDNAPSLSRAKSKKLGSEENRSFVTLAHHQRLVATIQMKNLLVL